MEHSTALYDAMLTTADVIARHALLVLTAVTLLTLAGMTVVWRTLESHAPRYWRRAATAWDALRATKLARALRGTPWLGRVLGGTLTTARYLGIYAICAFAFALAALAGFFEIAEHIGAGAPLARFDLALSAALREHLSYDVLSFFAVITHLGDRQFLIGLGALTAIALLAARLWLLAGAWIAATASGGVLSRVLKAIFERQRPIHDHGLLAETSFSFPSGHAMGSMLVYGLLGYLIARHTPRAWRIPVALAAATLIVFVGTSRVLLQVHYFSDVLAGYTAAAAWGALCVAGLEAVRWREAQRSHNRNGARAQRA